MSTQTSTPRPAVAAEPPAAPPPRGLTREPSASAEPGTRYAGSISLAAALAGILLGARSAGIHR